MFFKIKFKCSSGPVGIYIQCRYIVPSVPCSISHQSLDQLHLQCRDRTFAQKALDSLAAAQADFGRPSECVGRSRAFSVGPWDAFYFPLLGSRGLHSGICFQRVLRDILGIVPCIVFSLASYRKMKPRWPIWDGALHNLLFAQEPPKI